MVTDLRTATRKQDIENIYRTHLNREVDESGLAHYLFCDLTVEEIEREICSSKEYLTIQKQKNFGKQLESLGTGELLLMGSSPKTKENVEALRKSGIKAILKLTSAFECNYDHSWCSDYLNVPLDNDKPITQEEIKKILDFLYATIVVKGLKTFIHSSLGLSRAPLVVSLFLVAEKGIPFNKALMVVSSRHNTVNPSRKLMSADVLESAKKFRGAVKNRIDYKEVNKVIFNGSSASLDFVNIVDNLYIGSSIKREDIDKLKMGGVSIILDLNEKRTKLSSDFSWFSHIHLPLTDNNINSMMPVVMRNIFKYIGKGGLYILSSEKQLLIMLFEALVMNLDSSYRSRMDLSSLRQSLSDLR